MTDQLLLEVIDGPMDGLNCIIDKQGKIGRHVGNTLSLALDNEISGCHVKIIREGPTWCLVDQNSTNGTWYQGKKLTPGKSYPIKTNEIFLVGSTLILLSKGSILDTFSASTISDKYFQDPRKEYRLSSPLQRAWEILYGEIDSSRGAFCDVTHLFLAVARELGIASENIYKCIESITSDSKYKIFCTWLSRAHIEPSLQLMPGTLIIAPRVWRILDLAARKTKNELEISDLLKSILEEGKSLVASYIEKDRLFLDQVVLKRTISRSENHVSEDNVAKQARLEVVQPAKEKVVFPATPKYKHEQLCESVLFPFVQRIERTIRGFVEDALNPVSGKSDLQLPGLDKDLSTILASLSDISNADQMVKDHLEKLYNLLVLILAAQREGYKFFAKNLCSRLEKALIGSSTQSANILMRSKKNVDFQEISNNIRATLSLVESEGLSDEIVRENLKSKIQRYSSGTELS